MSQQLSDALEDLAAEQRRLVEDLRAEQIPSRPPPAALPRTRAQQLEAQRIAYAESLAYDRAHPGRQGKQLRAVS